MPQTDTPMTDTHHEAAAPRGRDTRILLSVLVALVVWGAAVAIWGLPGLFVPALALVPVIWAVLIIVSRG